MMVSPGYYAEQWEKLSYLELIKERDRLIRFLRSFEKKEIAGDRSDPEWRYSPSPDVQYQVHFEYLAELCRIMQERYNSEYVWGDRTLKQDADEEQNITGSSEE